MDANIEIELEDIEEWIEDGSKDGWDDVDMRAC